MMKAEESMVRRASLPGGETSVLSVILVNHNDRRHLEDCLTSLAASVCQLGAEVIVVDNASTDGSREFLEGRFSWVKLISNASNAGFSAANNQGVRQSLGDYLLFLNTDTIVYPETVGFLLEEMKRDPAVGAAGPALMRKDRTFQVSFGNRVGFFAQLCQKYILNPFYKKRLPGLTKTKSVGWLSAAFLLARRAAFNKAGGFDESFFIFFEDIDLCYRIRKAGCRLVFVPRARAVHEGGATTSALKYRSRIEYMKSQIYFYQKHCSRLSLALLRASLIALFRLATLRGRLSVEDRSLFKKELGPLLGKKKDGRAS